MDYFADFLFITLKLLLIYLMEKFDNLSAIWKYAWDCSLLGDQSVWATIDLEDNILLLKEIIKDDSTVKFAVGVGFEIEIDKFKGVSMLIHDRERRQMKKVDDPILFNKVLIKFNYKAQNISSTNLEIFDSFEILLDYLKAHLGSRYQTIRFESDNSLPIKEALVSSSLGILNTNLKDLTKLKDQICQDIDNMHNKLDQSNSIAYLKRIVASIEYHNIYEQILRLLLEETLFYWKINYMMESSTITMQSNLIHLLIASFDFYAINHSSKYDKPHIKLHSYIQTPNQHIPYLINDGVGCYIRINHFMFASSIQINKSIITSNCPSQANIYVTFNLATKYYKSFCKIGDQFTKNEGSYLLRPGNIYRISHFQSKEENEYCMSLDLVDLNLESSVIEAISFLNTNDFKLHKILLSSRLLNDVMLQININQNLQSLDLSELNLGRQTLCLTTIMSIFKKGICNITSLNLSFNNLGVHEENLKIICCSLEKCDTLKQLYLASNCISEIASNIIELTNFIKSSTRIKLLDLSTNDLSALEPDLIKGLIDALKISKSIKTVILDNNYLGNPKLSSIINSLISLKNIKLLSLYSNELDPTNFVLCPQIIM